MYLTCCWNVVGMPRVWLKSLTHAAGEGGGSQVVFLATGHSGGPIPVLLVAVSLTVACLAHHPACRAGRSLPFFSHTTLPAELWLLLVQACRVWRDGHAPVRA